MTRITLTALLVFLVTACESNEARDARYQVARSECTKIAAKTALAEPGSFGRKHEAIAAAALNGCLSARGFEKEVDVAMKLSNAQ
jgi:hypothetical protein